MGRQTHPVVRKVAIALFSTMTFGLFCFAQEAKAAPNLHVGALEFHPSVALQELHTDNVYSTSTARNHDYITRIIPGALFYLPVDEHNLQAEYHAVLERYGKYVEENTSDHFAKASGELSIASRFKIKLLDDYKKSHEPRGASSTGFIEKFWTNKGGVSLQYSLTDVSKVRLDSSYSKWDFKTSRFRNRHDQDNSLYVYYRIMSKTSVFAEYDHTRTTYEQRPPDLASKTDGGQVGLTWDMTARSKGTVKTGYIKKNFSDTSLKDHGAWTYSLDVRHEFSSKTNLTLIGERTLREASLLGTSYLQATNVMAELAQGIYDKFELAVNGSYEVDRYSNAVVSISPFVRRDVTASGGASLKYMMRDWLDFSLGYTHRTRNSNIDANDYFANEYMFQINARM